MKRFIHIPKNAGTSIRSWVSPMDYNDTKEELPEYIKSIGMDKHLPHSKLKPNSMFDSQFAVVRNPWARMVSLYHEKRHPDTKPMSFLTFISNLNHFIIACNGFFIPFLLTDRCSIRGSRTHNFRVCH